MCTLGMIARVVAFFAIIGPVLAQNRDQQSKTCEADSSGPNGVSSDLIIGSCTSLIQSGRASSETLAWAFTNRGWQYYYAKDDVDKGIKDFDQAIKLQPSYSRAWANRCLAYSSKGELDRAVEDCNSAVRLNPRDATALTYRGDVFKAKGDDDRAIQDFDRAIVLDPKWMWPLNDRTGIYYRRHQWDRVLDGYNRVIELAPDYGIGYSNRGEVYAMTGEYERSIQDYDRALKLGYAKRALIKRGDAYAMKGDYDRALADYGDYLKVGKLETGDKSYEEALKTNSNYAYVLYARGIAKIKQGDDAGGNADITAAEALKATIAEKFVQYGVK